VIQMGQYDVLIYLEQRRGWHSTKAIAKRLDKSPSVVALSLRKLHHWGLVEQIIKPKNLYLYKFNKGLNIRIPRGD
jgi:predicted transcriptional regulator